MQLTLAEAARLVGKHRTTLHRHLAAGRLSSSPRADGQRVIDLAELIRCYGEPARMPAEVQQAATAPSDDMQRAMLQALQAMHGELIRLREEVATLKRLPPPPAPGAPMPAGSEDDPHGLRALVARLRDDR